MSPLDQFPFIASLTGLINEATILLNGKGSISHSKGLTQGHYQLEKRPEDFSPFFLSACIITGYPNASRCAPGVSNPFQGVSYHYDRTLEFSTGERLFMQTSCDLQEDGTLNSHFKVSGTAPHIAVQPMEPLVESWQPLGPGRIRGRFNAAWKTETGQFITANATSEYFLSSPLTCDGILHRFIRCDSTFDNPFLEKTQHVLLFKDL